MTRWPAANLPTGDHDDRVVDHGAAVHEPGVAPTITIAPIEPFAVGTEQAAALIGVSRSAFYKLVDAGKIGPMGVRLGKHVRYPLAELREWARRACPHGMNG